MLSRSNLLSVLLLAANVAIAVRSYQAWVDGPRTIPTANAKALVSERSKAQKGDKQKPRSQEVLTQSIIDKNLFDPERGMGKSQADKQAEALAAAAQKLRSFVLVGTAILGDDRYAVVEEPVDPRLQGPRPQLQPGQRGEMRLKLGDTLEGFKLSDIEERTVVFENGASRVEIAVDYLRKMDDGRPRGPGSAPPGQMATKIPGQGADPDAPAPPLAPRFPRRDTRQ